MIKSGKCPECGRAVGSSPGVSPLKHAVGCLHVDFLPPAHLRAVYGPAAAAGQARAQHIMALVEMEGN